jgi:hypothetical protein
MGVEARVSTAEVDGAQIDVLRSVNARNSTGTWKVICCPVEETVLEVARAGCALRVGHAPVRSHVRPEPLRTRIAHQPDNAALRIDRDVTSVLRRSRVADEEFRGCKVAESIGIAHGDCKYDGILTSRGD